MTNQQLIDLCKKEVENVIKYQLGSQKYNYLIRQFSENIDSNTKIEFNTKQIDWDVSNRTEQMSDGYYSSNWRIPLSTKGTLIFTNNIDKVVKIEHSFLLTINIWFHFDSKKPDYQYDILDDAKLQLLEYNEKIWSIMYILTEKFPLFQLKMFHLSKFISCLDYQQEIKTDDKYEKETRDYFTLLSGWRFQAENLT